MKINFLLTFDYELPLGGCTSYEKGLFDPSRKLLDKANSLDVPVVLFVDICSAMQYKKWDYEYYQRFREQIQEALKSGHDVQLHIHPHWMDSKYVNGTLIPSSRFGLSDFKEHPSINIEEIIFSAIGELEAICREVEPDYQCLAFRAGGYNVEPESARILSALHEKGIRYESSVIPGLYQNFSFSKIDYRHVPRSNYWHVPITGPLTKVAEQEPYLIEYPISSMPNTIFNILKRRTYKTINKQEIKTRRYNSTGKTYSAISEKTALIEKVKMLMNPVVLTFDRDYMVLNDLEKIVNYQIKKNKGSKEIFITLISHPKSMGDYHLNLLEEFVLKMKSTYPNNLNFTSYYNLSHNDQTD